MADIIDTSREFLTSVELFEYTCAALMFLGIVCPLESKVDTNNPVRLSAFIFTAIGATVALTKGHGNLVLWFALIVLFLSYFWDFVQWSRKRHKAKYDRRAK